MKDKFGRTIDYIRISITDRCNLRCRYCMPHGIEWIPMEEILTLEEIVEVCKVAAQLGIRKVKITGGEPLVRKGCVDLVRMIKAVDGIEQVTLTTNGVLLEKYAKELYEAGIDGINVSLDTLQKDKYQEITGFDAMDEVLNGIREIQKYPVPLKINAVLQHGVNEEEFTELVELAKEQKLDVRFIEMMPIGYGKEMESISNGELLEKLENIYGKLRVDNKVRGNGPAVYYQIPGFAGCVGFISAVHGKFCSNCNRIRMTSTGFLKGCLCYEEGASVREALRNGTPEEVRKILEGVIWEKPKAHIFEHPEEITETKEMARIGG